MADTTPGETLAFHNPSTRRLRLQPLPPSDLPSHPLLQNTASATSLVPFVHEILSEALTFSDTLMHTEFQSSGKPKSSQPSTAPIQLLTFDLMQEANGKGETWFGRRSHHTDAAENGTGTWQEFENGLFHNHSENEGKYTPDVFDTRHIISYTAGEGLDAAALEAKGWEEVNVHIYEMGHRIPPPLNKRVFPVLIVRAKISSRTPPVPRENIKDADGFVTAQIPIDLAQTPSAFYSNGRHRSEGEDAEKKAKVVIGQYCSVERCRQQEDGKIVWEMATTSDAKGNLPMAVQKMGVPGAVIKDVGLFIKWVQEERGKGGVKA